MIAPLRNSRRHDSFPAWHARFLSMAPAIQRHARVAFGHLGPEAREEAVEECLANALVAFVRLVQLKKTELASTPYVTKAAGNHEVGISLDGPIHPCVQQVRAP